MPKSDTIVIIGASATVTAIMALLMLFDQYFDGRPATPRFTLSDCIQFQAPRESWETPWPIEQVIGLGREKYRLDDGSEWYFNQDRYKKVPCP